MTSKGGTRIETIEEFTTRRNGKLKAFFERRGLPIQLKGNPENPMIVLNEGLILSAYVNNFNLRMLTRGNQGGLVEEIKLTKHNIENYPVRDLMEIIEENEQTAGWRIKLKGHQLFVCGYAHADRDNSLLYEKDAMFPVFGSINLHIYKTEESAINVYDKLETTCPNLEIELDQYVGFGVSEV